MTDKTSSNKVWSQNASPHFQIALLSHENPERPVVSLVLDIQFTPTYPSLSPLVTLAETKNLLRANVARVHEKISSILKEYKGEEVCFTLIMDIKELLDDLQLTTEQVLSLEEERRKRLEAERLMLEQREKEARRKEKLLKMKKSKEANEEIRQINRDNGEDSRNMHGDNQFSGAGAAELLLPTGDAIAEESFVFDNTLLGDVPKSSAQFQFRAVTGFVRSHSKDLLLGVGAQYIVRPYVAPSTPKRLASQIKDLGYLLTVIELNDELWPSRDARAEIRKLEAQLEAAMSLPRSASILKVYGFQIDKKAGKKSIWEARILTELPTSQNLDSVLQTAGFINWTIARNWLIQILPALELLHNAGLAHRLICPLSVLLCDEDDELSSRILKLCHPTYGLTILDMAQAKISTEPNFLDAFIPRRWHDPDVTSDAFKGDIWQLGVLFMRVMLGYKVQEEEFLTPLDFFNHFDPYNYPGVEEYAERVFDLLSKMLQLKATKRLSILELNTVKFLRAGLDIDQTRHNALNLLKYEHDPEGFIDPEANTDVQNLTITGAVKSSPSALATARQSAAPSNAAARRRYSDNQSSIPPITNSFFQTPDQNQSSVTDSRYKREFEEVGKLGKGAFGEVVKARNRMEGTFYAIKKIKHKHNKLETLLSEVLSLARLNHQYIVRYYGCWVEDVIDAGSRGDSALSSETEDESELSEEDEEFDIPVNFRSSSFLKSHDNSFQVDYFSNSVALLNFGSNFDDNIIFANSDLDEPYADFSTTGESNDAHSDESDGDSDSLSSESSTDSESNDQRDRALDSHFAQGYEQRKCILYIQMEFCENNTLYDLIEKGLPGNPDEYWRLFREILEAVSYIHSSGFIHRDLKPTNIFIDKSNHIKVGDFGLAKNSQFSSAIQKDNQVAPKNKDLSTVVGTFFYTAKEVASGDYDEKVDMYSLGIIFFEMCYKLGTGMERAMILNKLRLVDVQFPSDFAFSKKPTEKKIISNLLSHDPKVRSSASELLQSGLIPVEHQDVIIKEALRSLADPASPWQQQVRETLFHQPYLLARDIMFDRVGKESHSDILEHTSNDYLILSYLLDTISEIFRYHGAIQDFSGSSLIPKSLMQSKEQVYELLDRNGTVLTLNYDLVLPLARFLSREKLNVHKLYTHEFVYRPNLRGTGKPDKYSAMIFDIFSHNDKSLVTDSAECIKAIDEIVCQFPCFRVKNAQTFILINHLDILNSIIDFAFGSSVKLSRSRRFELMGVLSQLVERSPDDVKNFLRTDFKVPHTVVKDLFDLFNFTMDPVKGIQKLRKIMVDSPLLSRIERCSSELQQIIQIAKKMGIKTTLTFNPLSNYNANYYDSGLMFQVIHRMDKNRKFCRVATGGRFDRLIEYLSNEGLTLARTPHGVGFQLNTTLLFLLMKNSKWKNGKEAENVRLVRCDVLVYSLQENIFKDCGYELMGTLWAHQISADWFTFTSNEDLVRKATSDGTNWIVQLRQPVAQGKKANKSLFKPIRVKDIATNKDIDLEYSELVDFLLSEIEFRRSELTSVNPAANVGINDSDQTNEKTQVGELIFNVEIDQKVIVVPNSAPRGRKNNKKDKWELENDSKLAAADTIKTLANATIVTVDLTDAVLDMILSTSLQVLQEEWLKRAFSTNNKLPKTFAILIHDTLMKEYLRGARWAILHSPRSDKTSIIDLQR